MPWSRPWSRRPRLSSTEPRRGRGLRVVGAIVLGLVIVFSVAFVVAEQAGLESAETWRGWVGSGGGQAGAAGIIGLALVADLVLPVPSSVVMTLSGNLLGFTLGTVVNTAGGMGAAWLGWGLSRALGRGAFTRLVGSDQPRVEAWFQRWGSWAIVLSRAVPMLTEVVSCLAGLHGVSFLRFTVLSLLGTLPVAAVYAWAGATGTTSLWLPLAVAFGLPALGYGAVAWIRRSRRPTDPVPVPKPGQLADPHDPGQAGRG